MLDIKVIRENPEKINELLKRRNPDLSIDKVLEIDEERRKIQYEADQLRAERKNISQKIGLMKKNGENTDEIQAKTRELGDKIKEYEAREVELNETQKEMLMFIPNTPDETTPIGLTEDNNVVLKYYSEPTKANFELKPHWDR